MGKDLRPRQLSTTSTAHSRQQGHLPGPSQPGASHDTCPCSDCADSKVQGSQTGPHRLGKKLKGLCKGWTPKRPACAAVRWRSNQRRPDRKALPADDGARGQAWGSAWSALATQDLPGGQHTRGPQRNLRDAQTPPQGPPPRVPALSGHCLIPVLRFPAQLQR